MSTTEPPSHRPTALGLLPVNADSIDLLDKALTGQREKFERRVRACEAENLAMQSELARLRPLRQALARGVGSDLARQLNELAVLIDPTLEDDR